MDSCIRDTKKVLNEKFEIDPKRTAVPSDVLQTEILTSPDNLTQDVLDVLNKSFFQNNFRTGLMIVIKDFEVNSYDQYFSVTKGSPSYLREYIRFYTAHADIRRISNKAYGFRISEVNQLKRHVKTCRAREIAPVDVRPRTMRPRFETIRAGGRTCQYQ